MRVIRVMLGDLIPERNAVFATVALILVFLSFFGIFSLVSLSVAWLIGVSFDVAMLSIMAIYGIGFGLYSWVKSPMERTHD